MPTLTTERRGAGWRFIIRVPKDLRQHYPSEHLRKHVPTHDKLAAQEVAFRWAAEVASEFRRIRETGSPLKHTISDEEADLLVGLMTRSILGADEESRTDGHYEDSAAFEHAARELGEADQETRLALSRGILGTVKGIALDWLWGHGYDVAENSQEFRRVAMRFAKARGEAIKARKLRNEGEWVETPDQPAAPVSALQPASTSKAPMLSAVIEAFLKQEDPDRPMFRKYRPTLAAFLEVTGDKPVNQLKQMDVEEFFETLCRLPPRWGDEKRKRGATIRELAEMEWEKCIGPKTFEDTYQASLRPFLNFATRRYGDQEYGFPTHLTAAGGIKYVGTREKGEDKQRPMKAEEIKRLFEGEEMRRFASDPEQAHCYWLPMIGLYTGARVNEVCQLHPAEDVIQGEGGIWLFNFTDDSGTDARVRKSIKNDVSRRRVPIHSRLVELGFLAYVERVKATGAAILFPQWPPTRGKASGAAEKWFRGLLVDTGMRDETPKKRLVGFHAFRSTFENRAMNLDVANAEWLTGHAGSYSKVLRGYRGEAELRKKQAIMERIRFDVEPPSLAP